MKKRMIAMLLCVLMVLSSMGGAVFAADEPVTAEEPIAEETVPPVDEFEVVDPHPLEGTVTEEIPVETETPEIVEPLPTEEPTAAETPTEEETEPEATDPTEDSMSSGVLDMEEEEELEPIVFPSITVTPGMTEEELLAAVENLPDLPLNESGVKYAGLENTSVNAAATPVMGGINSFSDSYMTGQFYTNVYNAMYNSSIPTDIVNIAYTQIGYYDGSHVPTLAGGSFADDGLNYSEYGWFHDIERKTLIDKDWNPMFVSWCARKAGIPTSIVPACRHTSPGGFGTSRYDFENIQRGDIVHILQDGSYRVGIVYKVSDGVIYTIEGQREAYDVVYKDDYLITSTLLHSYTSPNYLDSWDYINSGWYYRNVNGTIETGLFEKNGHWYYLDPNNGGRMVTGWKQIDGTWYYFRPEANDNGPQGSRVSGWVSSGSYWYYMDPENNGAMATGWRDISSVNYNPGDFRYYFLESGKMATGWLELDNVWYYFRPSANDNGPQGSRVVGWIPYNDFWYYADPNNNGAMVTGWKDIGEETYYFTETVPLGRMVTGWQEIDGIWYHFDIYDSLGALNTGWYETSAGRYYLDPDTGAMTIGWREIDDVWYYFDENGRVVE